MTRDSAQSTSVEIRFADLDAYGHVNNAVYFTYLETARTKLFHDKFMELMSQSMLFLVVKAECEYKFPITLTDNLIVTLTVSRVGNSSFDIDYEMHNGNGKMFARAKTVMVCFDNNLQKPVRVPDNFIKTSSET